MYSESDPNRYEVKYSINEKPDGILYRSTWNSFPPIRGEKRESGEASSKGSKGNRYEPDIILKWEGRGLVRYIIADARHMDYEMVRSIEMSALVGKYLNSVQTCSPEGINAEIAGVVAIYSDRPDDGSDEDYFKYAFLNGKENQFARFLYINVDDENENWKEQLGELLDIMMHFRLPDEAPF